MDSDFQFTWDTTSQYETSWRSIFRAPRWSAQEQRTIVEIGCFEGRATVWMLQNLVQHPASTIYCVDPFAATGAKEKEVAAKLQLDWDKIFRRFQSNIGVTGKASQVKLLKQPSSAALPSLLNTVAGRVDFVYVDGSHRAPDVLSDFVFSFYQSYRSTGYRGVEYAATLTGGARPHLPSLAPYAACAYYQMQEPDAVMPHVRIAGRG